MSSLLQKYAVAASSRPVVPVIGSDEVFPVRRIYCVGRNYAAHAREMGYDPAREPPFFFSKPSDAIVPIMQGVGDVVYPPATRNLQHEVELVAALSSGGANIAPGSALDCVFAYAVGLDLTRRDLQLQARENGHPWDMSKGFDQSAPISALRPAAVCGHPESGEITLSVNGDIRQRGDLNQMIWSLAEVIVHLSTYVTLCSGDLIFCGTPAGVSTVERGDILTGRIAGVGDLSMRLV